MPKFAANLTMLYNEVEFLDRFGAAARAGFKGVEYLFPYQYPKEQLAETLERHACRRLPCGNAYRRRCLRCRCNTGMTGVANAPCENVRDAPLPEEISPA
ncbi:hydroxypyruvate isomerase [Caballeronia choica]|jgi:hypothetical protein|uniref:Hydroxypyruvate isomerase n=1 Tax=Caballeronia choica TaxID=326476 RepID=A0A158IS63_9BURK|nr:hydroxypyruvate isomerase [Caballeronia choica]